MNNYFLFFIFLASLKATVIQLPKEYDNLKNSILSKQIITINNNNTSSTISTGTYYTAGESLRLRCRKIKKIQCTNSTAKIQAQINNIDLTDSKGKKPFSDKEATPLIPVLKRVVVENNTPSEWAICAVAVGMYSEDSSILIQEVLKNGDVKYTLEYSPLLNQKKFVYFSNSSHSGGANSSIEININQYCE